MNTRTLNRRLKGYVKPKLWAGNEDSAVVDIIDDLQSITDEDDNTIDTSHDTTDVVDSMYLPNPAIVTEMMTEINEAPEITNADTAVKLLSDSNEALRRLDIISMNVNYPVSGYRSSQATILKAEPGLESTLGYKSFSRQKLNVAIEAISSKLLVGVITAVIAAIGTMVFKAIARMRKRNSAAKPPTAEEIAASNAARNKADEEKIQRYFEVTWSQQHKHTQGTVADIKATEDRIDMIIKLGQGVDKEIDNLQRECAILQKAVYDNDYSGLDDLMKTSEVNQGFYDLAGELEDAMEGLLVPKNEITREQLSTNISTMTNSLRNFNTRDFEVAGSKVARLKNSLELLRAHVDKMNAGDNHSEENLGRLRTGVRKVSARAMKLAMAYRAADAQDFAINQAYSFFATYLRHIEKVTGNVKDDGNIDVPD